MLLKSLEIQGFKTFPDKTNIKFDRGVTAVVGPNGSGKSNVSDAIRWVLGEQSNRALRCSKTEDVIFSGTNARKAQGFAQVTLNINNSDRTLNFDKDEVSITRRFFRSGESEYLINKTSVRLKDIHEIFMDTGLGRDGYSIIGQGRIDEIISSKPEDRREIFEEASGISKYKYRKNEAVKRLDKTKENLVRLRDIFGEIESKIDPLKSESEKAKDFLKLSESKKKLEISIWADTLEKSDKILEEQFTKIDLAKNQISEIESKLENSNLEFENAYQQINEYTVQLDEINKNISAKEQNISENERDLAILKNNIKHNEKSIADLLEDIKKTKFNSEDLNAEELSKKEKFTNLDSEINNKKRKLSELEENFKLTDQNLFSIKENIEDHTNQLNILKEKISNYRLDLAVCGSSHKELTASIDMLNSNSLDIEKNIDKTRTELDNIDKQIGVLSEHISNSQNSLGLKKSELEDLGEKIEILKTDAEKINLSIFEQNKKASLLEDLENNLEGFQKSVKQIMQAKKRGNLLGIHGPVSRIFSVAKKYSLAVEVALAAAMQNIVVDNEQNAKDAILFLKNNNLGRATFLPLNTIKPNKYLDKSDFAGESGFVAVAAELCDSDKQYKDIIYSLLGRVIIAKDINTAFLIAKHNHYRFRVVSLDGQLVNMGGSLTGGSQLKNSGILSRADDIKKLRNYAKNLEEDYRKKLADLQKDKLNYDKLQSELSQFEVKLFEDQNKKIELKAFYNHLKQQLESEGKKLIEIKEQKKAMELKFEEGESVQLSAEKSISDSEAQIDLLKSKLDLLNTNKKRFETQHTDLTQQINDIKFNIISKEAEFKSVQQEINSIVSRKLDRDTAVNEMQSKIDEIQRQNENYNLEISNKVSLQESLKSEVEVKKSQIDELIKNRNLLEQNIVNLRKSEQSIMSEKEILTKDLARLEEKYSNLKNTCNDIAEKLWTDYELSIRQAKELAENIDNMQATKKQLNMLKSQIKRMGNVNVAAIEEYKELKSRYDFMKEQISDIEKSRKELTILIKDLTSQMKDIFSHNFKKISENFSLTFQELLGGGKACLKLNDSENVLDSGIEIEVQPKGKLISRLEALSGGEKALVAISLYFAILKVRPAPFCVLDEIEAALDDINVDRFAKYLNKMNSDTQFIVITHRRGTMEASDVLYGVTMQDEGISRILSLSLSEAMRQVAK